MAAVRRHVLRLGGDAALVDWAHTLNHELLHLSTGLAHEGHDDVCLQEAERFMRKALLLQPLDLRLQRMFLKAASLRRKTGHG